MSYYGWPASNLFIEIYKRGVPLSGQRVQHAADVSRYPPDGEFVRRPNGTN